jgi:hypothetical protein
MAAFGEDSVRVSIAISQQTGGGTVELDTLDTGAATPRGQADPGFHSDNLIFGTDFRTGALAFLTHRAWTDAAVALRNPNVVATGTIQVKQTWSNSYVNYSVEVKQVDDVIHFTSLQTTV